MNNILTFFLFFPVIIQPLQHGQAMDPILRKCQQVLDPLIKAAPGLIEGIYLMGKVKFLSGNAE